MVGAAIISALRRSGYDVLDGAGEVLLDRPGTVAAFFERHRPQHAIVAAGKAAGITGNQRHPADLIHDNLLVATHVIHSGRQRREFLFADDLASACILALRHFGVPVPSTWAVDTRPRFQNWRMQSGTSAASKERFDSI